MYDKANTGTAFGTLVSPTPTSLIESIASESSHLHNELGGLLSRMEDRLNKLRGGSAFVPASGAAVPQPAPDGTLHFILTCLGECTARVSALSTQISYFENL